MSRNGTPRNGPSGSSAGGELPGVVEPRDRQGVDGGVERLHPLDRRLEQLAGRDLALGDQRRLIDGVHPAGLVGQRTHATCVPRTATVARRCSPSTRPLPSGRELIRDRSVAAFLIAATAQTIATTMQAAALGKQIYDITDSELQLGLLGLVEFLPALLLLPLTGSAADRFDRRRVASIAFAAEVADVGPVLPSTRRATRPRRCRSSSSPRCSAPPGPSPHRRTGRCRR